MPTERHGTDRQTASVQGEGLREAARKLIGAYMADDDLAPHINALEAAAGFMQQGAKSEPPVPAPSDEAGKRWTIYLYPNCAELRGELERVRAEGEAARTAEIVAWLRRPQGMGGDSVRRMGDANAIAREFGIDGDVSL